MKVLLKSTSYHKWQWSKNETEHSLDLHTFHFVDLNLCDMISSYCPIVVAYSGVSAWSRVRLFDNPVYRVGIYSKGALDRSIMVRIAFLRWLFLPIWFFWSFWIIFNFAISVFIDGYLWNVNKRSQYMCCEYVSVQTIQSRI